jgi:hypothetical protein
VFFIKFFKPIGFQVSPRSIFHIDSKLSLVCIKILTFTDKNADKRQKLEKVSTDCQVLRMETAEDLQTHARYLVSSVQDP